ncbi:6,7-dimethyl-8-ribityllumazine synthase [Pelagibacteraceae bacterium]|nr:6,7-dimethyl-8-ribityllumazine synthase [Pelagibacteraceae bacterium]
MKFKIAIINSIYYRNVSKDLINGALVSLKKHSKYFKIKEISVPGAFEIPFEISRNIESYDAFIALGCIIKGKTPHFDFISGAITNSLMQLSIQNKKPISNGVITCLNMKQALERSNIRKKNKGGEAAKAIIALLKIPKINYERS